MRTRRWILAPGTALLIAWVAATARAEPIDTWDYSIDCEGDPWNPLDENGNRTGADPDPGTEEWTTRNENHLACTDQRNEDRNHHPVNDSARSAAMYGIDWFREIDLHANIRFRHDEFPAYSIPTVPAAEVFRPCRTLEYTDGVDDCPGMPEGLERFDPPYPVVIVLHGFIGQMKHHRFNTQVFAENGYLAIGVDGYAGGAAHGPRVQRTDNPDDVLNWLANGGATTTPLFDGSEIAAEADLARVALAGHSQGSGIVLGYQGDPRVDAILAWDGGDGISENNCAGDNPCAPIMYQRTDGGFSTSQSYPDDYPSGRNRGLETYETHKERGMDVFHLTARSTVHVDWNGRGVGLSLNRLFEDFSNYYNVAWLDRHAKGKLVFDEDGDVATSAGRSEAEERAFRQAIVQDAFDRLTAKRFSGTNVHNISMGFWDPEKAEASGDPLRGGNVPYRLDGSWTMDRFSWYYRSFCHVTVPDYVGGGTGAPGEARLAVADSGGCDEDGNCGDMRLNGCPEIGP